MKTTSFEMVFIIRDLMSNILSRKDAAKRLGVSLPTIDRLIARSDFPVIRLGRSVKIPEDQLNDWITKNLGKVV